MGSTTINGVFNKNKKMTKEPKLPHKLKWGDRTAARVDEKVWGRRGGRMATARRLKGHRRVYEEVASPGILQVYKT